MDEKKLLELWQKLYDTPKRIWVPGRKAGKFRPRRKGMEEEEGGFSRILNPAWSELREEAERLIERMGVLPEPKGLVQTTWKVLTGYREGQEVYHRMRRIHLLCYQDLFYGTLETGASLLQGEPVIVESLFRGKDRMAWTLAYYMHDEWVPRKLGFLALPYDSKIVKRPWIPKGTRIDKGIWHHLRATGMIPRE